MKTRQYIVKDFSKAFMFCPNCHQRIQAPFGGNIKVKSSINIRCGICLNGKIEIKQAEEVK